MDGLICIPARLFIIISFSKKKKMIYEQRIVCGKPMKGEEKGKRDNFLSATGKNDIMREKDACVAYRGCFVLEE